MKWIPAIFLSAGLAMAAAPTQRVGQPLVITDVYIPGGEAEPAPRRDREPPLVVRLTDVKPAQDGFRYDFEVQGLDPGKYDLATFLVPSDPAVPPRFPQIPLEITATLPGVVMPVIPAPRAPQGLGGYRTMAVTAGALWLAGLAGILFWMRKRAAITAEAPLPPSLAERMRPLLDQAAAGRLAPDGRATLERMILGYWRTRLPDTAGLPASAVMSDLRRHPQASPLVLALERWLHSPQTDVSQGEIDKLLSTYR